MTELNICGGCMVCGTMCIEAVESLALSYEGAPTILCADCEEDACVIAERFGTINFFALNRARALMTGRRAGTASLGERIRERGAPEVVEYKVPDDLPENPEDALCVVYDGVVRSDRENWARQRAFMTAIRGGHHEAN